MIATMPISFISNPTLSVLDYGHADSKIQTGFSNTATTLKEIFKVADHHYWQPVSRITPTQKFELLALTWQRDTSLDSFASDIASHPAYQQIVGMGQQALPLIFEKMQKQPQHWFPALQAITGINPIKKENRGNIAAMTQDWLDWGVRYGFVNS